MTVRELMTILEKCEPDYKVVVCGYENGVDDVEAVRLVDLKEQPEARWYDGSYLCTCTDKTTAVYIQRKFKCPY